MGTHDNGHVISPPGVQTQRPASVVDGVGRVTDNGHNLKLFVHDTPCSLVKTPSTGGVLMRGAFDRALDSPSDEGHSNIALGSIASRNASPTKFMASIVAVMQIPGASQRQGRSVKLTKV